MQKYVKRGTGIVVQAMQLTSDNVAVIANWAQAQIVEEKDALTHETFDAVNIKTAAGVKRASQGMYVVKFDGHFFVAQPGKFEKDYELVQPAKTVTAISEQRRPTRDPFDGMTRFNEGPKP